MKLPIILAAIIGATGVLAGCNCKCQDPSGTEPQYNAATEIVCHQNLPGENSLCGLNKIYHSDQHHQCSSSTCCIDSDGFDRACRALAAPARSAGRRTS